ncbi:MAG: A/G-specific adenine glycosylase [Verrucomicrobiae bacterium]|nr:A/G-specific adenine glycosylase [Verrucomicrobiae bacterium]
MQRVKRKDSLKSNGFSVPWSSREMAQFRKKILTWYKANQRDLPWRRTRDPYAIAVSEIMLQQTQVATVIPYFNRWLKQFPTWQTLARASEEKVLKMWEGLGYYQRARNLHAAAKHVVKQYGGQLPADWEAIYQLPGMGRYTAGAIASIAFSLKKPVLDGNVIRVLSRLMDLQEPVNERCVQDKLWQWVEELVPWKEPGIFNQALMELGAMLCTKRSPACGLCPLRFLCRAKNPKNLPYKSQKTFFTSRVENVAISFNKEFIWMKKQESTQRWKGLWCFPEIQKIPAARPWRELLYSITRYRVTLRAYFSSVFLPNCKEISWAQLQNLPMPSPHRKLADILMKERKGD